jgi:pimeloyl-ACP methyl ester carboxylesterase
MKNIKKSIKFIGVMILILLIIALFFPTWTQDIKAENSISVLEQVEINGSKHKIMIRGNDKDNPVIILVHGGPGNPEIPYVTKYQNLLEKDFTVVHYDQRASGKSYHFFEDYSNLSSDLLVEDLLAMTDYISKRLGKEKVILVGHSFGTHIAPQAASKAPEKYEAYIGIGQMSNTIESEIDGLNFTIEQAQKAGNTEDVSYLQGLTEKIKNGEMFTPRNYVAKYGGYSRLNEKLGDDNISVLFSSEYNLLDVIRYNRGIGYSQNILLKDIFENPISTIVTKLEIPTYFVMGKYDYMTSSNAAKNYFDKIEANQKNLFLLSNQLIFRNLKKRENFINGCPIHL